MTIISRYLVSTYIRLIATCLCAFVATYLIVDFLERIGKFARAGAPPASALTYFLFKVPEIVVQTAPMAVLMGTILTIGLLSRSNEINAMRSSGISLVQIGRPLLVTAALASLLLIGIGELIVPPANEKVRYIDQVIIQKKGMSAFFRQNNIWFRDDRYILQARLFDPVRQHLEGVTVWQLDRQLRPELRLDADRAVPTPSGLRLAAVTLRQFPAGRPEGETRTPEVTVAIDLKPDDLKVVAKSAEDMGFTSLWRYCDTLTQGGYDATPYRSLLHAKLSAPFAALVMAFLGIPFALGDNRSKGIGAGITLSLVIGLAYFLTNAIVLTLGRSGALPPLVAAWAANLIFAAVGLWFTLTIDS
jgi:lipopolysaccharide export system permease protein